MASSMLDSQSSKPMNHYVEGLRAAPSGQRPSWLGRDDKKGSIGTDVLKPDYLPHGPYSLPPDGRLPPTFTSHSGFLRPIPESPQAVSTGTTTHRFCTVQWRKYKALIFIFGAQLFAALMNVAARLLELGDGDSKLHPMQILFFRMVVTTMGCSLYVANKPIQYGILGPPKVRWLLIVRGLAGFIGIYGMWYSIEYIPLAEATVITFLAPILSGYWCYLFLREPFTRTEQLASLLALGGVVLIAKPASLFAPNGAQGPAATTPTPAIFPNATITALHESDGTSAGTPVPTASERLGAIVVALIGVLGASFAFTSMRAIGTRAHTFVSVNYFCGISLLVTFIVLFLAPYLDIDQPDLRLGVPSSLQQWGLLAFITVCGLATQVLTTKGLSAERSNRATAMMYTQMLFAAGFDRVIWGTTMSWMSTMGCTMIIVGAVWVALGNKEETKGNKDYEEEDIERGHRVNAQGEDAVLLGEEPDDLSD